MRSSAASDVYKRQAVISAIFAQEDIEGAARKLKRLTKEMLGD